MNPQFDICPVSKMVTTHPEAIALDDGHRRLSYRELDHLIAKVSGSIVGRGGRRGDRVAILADNSIDYVILMLSLWRGGMIACPLSTRATKTEIDSLLENLNVCFIIVSDQFPELPSSTEVITFDELFKYYCDDEKSVPITIDPDQPITIVHTSGSQGIPHPIVHTWRNHLTSAAGSNGNIVLEIGDRWLLSLPLYHVGGFGVLFRCFSVGATVIIPDPDLTLADQVAYHKPTHLSFVPTQLDKFVRTRTNNSISDIKAVLVGGGATSKGLIEKAHKYGLPLFMSYGSTEMASQITTTAPEAALDELFTAGKPLSGRELKINANEQILVRGTTLCAGYWKNRKIVLLTDADGWYHTGDRGFLDDKGNLVVIGRVDRMFISGGENIYPEEIESVLNEIPQIAEAAVLGRSHSEFGYRPVAVIKLSLDKKLTVEDLINRLRKRLSRFKIPDKFFLWPDDDDRMKPSPTHLKKLVNQGMLTELK